MKRRSQPIVVLTAYDAPTARIEADAGVDIILVGDSVGTNVLGYESERDVTIADIIHHVGAVRRGAPDTILLADLPFATYDDEAAALGNARLLCEAGANMVKLEGARPDIVRALAAAGIATCGHLGLECQHHDDKRLKATTAKAALALEEDALALDRAGVDLLVLELMPEEVAARITRAVAAPTIGIGAGRHTDGQVLVVNDILGFTDRTFRHNRVFADIRSGMRGAIETFVGSVRQRDFPATANVFAMRREEVTLMSGDE